MADFFAASKMLLENRADKFGTQLRRLIYRFRERWKAQCLKKHFINLINEYCGMVKFWITTEVGKFLYMQSWINTT